MHYNVFVENQPDHGYIATVVGWPDCVGVGSTREEAIARARTSIQDCLQRGEIVRIQVGESATDDPWESIINSFAADPHWDEFQAELRRLREEGNRA